MQDFTEISPDRILYRDEHFFIIKDAFPVSPGHMLIISNEVRKDYFKLTTAEMESLGRTIDVAKRLVEYEHTPNGYNIGMNCGDSVGL
jgi:diadenosine tetraphosphate (Ap4A) HIT family hydrolase